jgi:hypothetical protein
MSESTRAEITALLARQRDLYARLVPGEANVRARRIIQRIDVLVSVLMGGAE